MSLSRFPQQRQSYRQATRRINIWDGPIRSGKTVASIDAWIKFLGTGPTVGDYVMTGKTNGTLYRNIIRPMQATLGSQIRYGYEHDTRVVSLWGKKIYCFGASDERAEQKIRGGTFAGAYGDEITLWPQTYFNQMLGRLSVTGARFIGTTNPDNPNHYLKTGFIDKKHELDCAVFNWPLEANTFLDPKYIENLKKEYTGLFYRRYILGEWCVAEGAIYDFFDEDLHTGSSFPNPNEYYVSIDYGIGNPTSFGLYAVNKLATPKAWRVKGYWWDSSKEGKQKTDAELSKDLKEWLGDITPRAIFVDPSAASLKLQIQKDHNFLVKDADNSVLDGIQTQSKMLKTGEYMIARHPSNAPCIKEYYGYVWDANASKRGEDKPKKTDDHTKDEERYFLHTLFGTKQLDYEVLTKW